MSSALTVQAGPCRRPRIGAVLVVIPAHDEEERIGACLDSVRLAVREVGSDAPGTEVSVLVVLDRCSDRTADIVGLRRDVRALPADFGCVGAARRAGVEFGAVDLVPDPAAVLVVNTDADCTVPPDWLVEHVALARDHDVVLGEVQPQPDEMSPASMALWWERHPVGRGSLHGANLAVRLDAYQRAGGFPHVASREDALLVRALRASGASVVGGTRVTTSGRRLGRVPGGFATYLTALDLELGTTPRAAARHPETSR